MVHHVGMSCLKVTLTRHCTDEPDVWLAERRAGLLPLLISAVGQDAAGDLLLSQWRQLGLDTQAIHSLPGLRTPSVSIIFDSGEHNGNHCAEL